VDKDALTAADKAFLTARRMYLSAAEREDLGVGEPAEGGGNTPNDPPAGGNHNGNAGDEYDELKGLDGHKALKAELESRNLPTDGKIDELRERLRADDKAKAEADAGTE